MTLRYICDRCDLRAESSVGHHVCEAPSDRVIDESIAVALGYVDVRTDDEDRLWARIPDARPRAGREIRFPDSWAYSLDTGHRDLTPIALARGYRFTLTQLGADEYRVSFFCNIDTLASTAIDTTPARAFARAWLRLPTESEGGP